MRCTFFRPLFVCGFALFIVFFTFVKGQHGRGVKRKRYDGVYDSYGSAIVPNNLSNSEAMLLAIAGIVAIVACPPKNLTLLDEVPLGKLFKLPREDFKLSFIKNEFKERAVLLVRDYYMGINPWRWNARCLKNSSCVDAQNICKLTGLDWDEKYDYKISIETCLFSNPVVLIKEWHKIVNFLPSLREGKKLEISLSAWDLIAPLLYVVENFGRSYKKSLQIKKRLVYELGRASTRAMAPFNSTQCFLFGEVVSIINKTPILVLQPALHALNIDIGRGKCNISGSFYEHRLGQGGVAISENPLVLSTFCHEINELKYVWCDSLRTVYPGHNNRTFCFLKNYFLYNLGSSISKIENGFFGSNHFASTNLGEYQLIGCDPLEKYLMVYDKNQSLLGKIDLRIRQNMIAYSYNLSESEVRSIVFSNSGKGFFLKRNNMVYKFYFDSQKKRLVAGDIQDMRIGNGCYFFIAGEQFFKYKKGLFFPLCKDGYKNITPAYDKKNGLLFLAKASSYQNQTNIVVFDELKGSLSDFCVLNDCSVVALSKLLDSDSLNIFYKKSDILYCSQVPYCFQ